ncbi:hypothetical protein ILUMI_23877 [Ignelater luminosus]|uniref:BolA-like protein 3 n=1 Tax=Ignelater luminosus TaxID=2038154 RepID=A0A8K0FZA2_IGNLU|nr:hypothetical protein ILUMI_23877 [Ignelater luminosus]
MRQLVKNFIYLVSQRYSQRTFLKQTLPRFWYGSSNYNTATSEEQLRKILEKQFPQAKVIQVEDVSGGCGAMYNIYVETKDFKGLSIPKQHQAIYAALNEQIKQIHGLHVVTKVPP